MVLRPESSVSVGLNEHGELQFPCDLAGPVIHRTPEELGIPRVIPDVPVRVLPNVRPDFEDEKRIRSQSRRIGVKRDAPRRERCVMPVREEQQQEQPQILRGAQDDRPKSVEGEGEMPGRTPDDVRKQILAAASELSVEGLRKKFGLSWLTVKTILDEAGVEAKSGVKPGPRAKEKEGTALQRTIDVDPKREGTAAALIGALARRDAATAPAVRIELTQAEVAEFVGRLSDAQRGAFLAAGLKAAILG